MSAGGGASRRLDLASSPRLRDLLARCGWGRGLRPVGLVLLVTWAPLLALSAAQGLAWGGGPGDLTFLRDLVANARVVVAIPLLLVGVGFARSWLAEAVETFERGGLVTEAARPRFREAVRACTALTASPWADLVALTIAVASSALLPDLVLARAADWRSSPEGRLTLAGAWHAAVVVPLYRFLVLRWTFALAAWASLLVRVARLDDLRPVPTHPDRAGGLSFVGTAHQAFAPVVLAMAALFAADLGNRVLWGGLAVEDLPRPIAVFVAVVVAVWLAPLLAFTPALMRLRRRAVAAHLVLASGCVRAFDAAWVRGGGGDPALLLRGETLQNVGALREVFDLVQRLKPVPLDLRDLLAMVAVALLPMLPLVLAAVPPAEVARLLRSALA